MELFSLIANIHWIPVLVVTLLSFALGFFWHTPFMFGKFWTEENKPQQKKVNIPLTFGGTAVLHLIALVGLSAVVSGKGLVQGALTGLLISILWVLTALGGTYLFANRSLKLLAIDAGMYIVLFTLAGLILGIW